MVRIIAFGLITLLLSGCSTNNKAAEISVNKKLDTISLELTTHLGDKQHFIEGDEIQFLLNISQDAYIYMYYVDAVKNITQILPSKYQQSNFYSTGYFQTIPEYENLYRFTIRKPFGKESIWVIASDQSVKLKQLPADMEELKQQIKNASKKAYGDYVLEITTQP